MSSNVLIDRLQFSLTATFHYIFPMLTMGLALLNATYKPAKCDGRPCDSDFSFKYRFELERHHTARTYWNPAMWTPSPTGVHY